MAFFDSSWNRVGVRTDRQFLPSRFPFWRILKNVGFVSCMGRALMTTARIISASKFVIVGHVI